MVTTVRAMAEAVYRDVVLMQSQLARSPPDWEQLWRLAELRGRLCENCDCFHQDDRRGSSHCWMETMELLAPSMSPKHKTSWRDVNAA
ncbi:Protein FRG2 [Manis javanica]|nr:Protein FRG2 [Manis javanica]